MAGMISAANGTDGAYTEALMANADNYGFTTEQVQNIPHARLLFVTDEVLPYSTETFAQFNQQEKKAQSSVEKAVAKSKGLDAKAVADMLSIIDSYESLQSFFNSANGCAAMLRAMQDNGIIGFGEVAGLTEENKQGDNVFNATGREFVQDVLLGALFDERTIRQMGGDRGLKQAIFRALGVIVENRKLGKYALSKEINNAISLLYEARKAKYPLHLYIRQTNMFEGRPSDRYTAFEILIAEKMESGIEDLRQVMDLYNNSAKSALGGQADMFEGILTKENIINQILERYGRQQEKTNSRGNKTEHAVQGVPTSGQRKSTAVSTATTAVTSDATTQEAGQGAVQPVGVGGSVSTIDDISDEDFSNPTRDVVLPSLSDEVTNVTNIGERNAIIKKSVFEKNKREHPELLPEDSRKILKKALYSTDLLLNDKPSSKPNYWILVNIDGKFALVNIDTDTNKKNAEIVGWRWSSEKDIDRIKRRSGREGGQVLITQKGAADLSALSTGSDDKGTKKSETASAKAENGTTGKGDNGATQEETKPDSPEIAEKKAVAQKVADRLGVKVEMVTDAEQLPKGEDKARKAISNGLNVLGWYNPRTGKAYIYVPNVSSEQDVEETILHEVVAHKGLRDLLGNDKFDELCDHVFKQMTVAERERWVEYVKQKPISQMTTLEIAEAFGDKDTQRAAADEYMANMAEGGVENPSVWERIKEFVKEALRSMGFMDKLTEKELTDRDIVNLLRASRVKMQTGEAPKFTTDKNGHIRFKAVYHGSPYEFKKFLLNKIGIGEGNQAFGWGLYTTDVEGIARKYANHEDFSAIKVERKIEEGKQNIVLDEIENALTYILDSNLTEYKDFDINKSVSDVIKELERKETEANYGIKEAIDSKEAHEKALQLLPDLTEEQKIRFNNQVEYADRKIEAYTHRAERALNAKKHVEENGLNDFKFAPNRHLYTVEIPDNNGSNYLEWDKPLTDELVKRVKDFVRQEWGNEAADEITLDGIKLPNPAFTGEDLYNHVRLSVPNNVIAED